MHLRGSESSDFLFPLHPSWRWSKFAVLAQQEGHPGDLRRTAQVLEAQSVSDKGQRTTQVVILFSKGRERGSRWLVRCLSHAVD